MKRTGMFLVAVICAVLLYQLLLNITVHSAAITSTATGGNWSATSTWVGGVVPTSTDDVTIASGATVTVNASATANVASLTVSSSATLTVGSTTTAKTVTVSGDVTNNGTIQPNNPGTTTAHTLQTGGNFTNNGTFTSINGTGSLAVTFNGSSAQSISGSSTTSFQNLTISNTAASVSSTVNLNVNGTMTVNSTAVFSPGAAVVLNSSAANGTITGSGSIKVTRATGTDDFNGQYKFSTYILTNLTVDYAGTAAQEVSAASYNKLTISNTAANVTASSVAGISVSGTMTINSNAVFVPDAAVVINSAAAAGTITGSGTIKVTRTAATADYSNQYKFSTNSLSSLTVDYAGTGDQTINAPSSGYGSLKTSGSGTKTMGGAVTVNNNVTIGSSTTLDESTRQMTLAGGAIITISGTLDFTSSTGLIQSGTSNTTTLTMGSNGVIRTVDDNGLGPATNASLQTQNGGSWSTSSLDTNGTVEYYRTGSQPVTDRNYNNLTITNTGTKTWTLAADRTINGNLLINSSAPLTFSGTQTVSVGGNWTNSGTFTAGTSTVTFNGNGNTQTLSGNTTFKNLTINHTGSNNVTASGSTLTVTGLLHVQSGTFISATAYADVTIDSGATLSLSGDITVSGNWTNNGGTLVTNNHKVTFNGSAAQTIGGTSSTTFYDLEIANSSNTVSLGHDETVSHALTVTSGTFDQGASYNLTTGTVTVNSSTTFQHIGTGNLTLSGDVSNAGTITINGGTSACGEADSIQIRSSDTTQRAWSGVGTFDLTDVDVARQGGTALITVKSGTNSGNNGSNWVFLDVCVSSGQTVYTWTPVLGDTNYQNSANWTPTRTTATSASPSTTDIIVFNGTNTPTATVTNVPTQSIAALQVTNGAFVTMSPSATNTLTINGGNTNAFAVDVGNSLTLDGALTISLTSNSTGTVGGFMVLQNGSPQLIAASGSTVTFSGASATFTTASNYNSSTNPFGTGTSGNGSNSSIIFTSGSDYIHHAGGSPFGAIGAGPVVVFQTGSQAEILNGTNFQANGRTYANLVIGDGNTAVTATDSGSSNFQFDNLTVKSTSTTNSSLSFTGSGSSTVTIQGNISSTGTGNGGSLSDITLGGGSSGGITIAKSGGGAINFTTTSSRSIDFESNATVSSGTTLSLSRILIEGQNTSSNYVLTISGGFSGGSTAYVIGNLRKTPTNGGTTAYEVGTANGYSPVTLSSVSNLGGGTFTARANQAAMPNVVDSSKVLHRYWTLTNGGITSAILSFQYIDADVFGDETKYKIFKDTNGSTPLTFPEGATDNVNESTNTATTTTAQTTFSNWSVGEPAAVTLVRMRSFTSKGFNGGNLVEWETGYEVDNLGFNLYRMSGGKLVRVTPSIVAGSALVAGRAALTAGLSYSWWDAQGLPDSQYYVEDVDLNGKRTMHGPAATQYAGNLESPSKQQAALLSQISSAPSDTTRFVTGYPADVERVAKMPTVTAAKSGERLTVVQDAPLQKQRAIAAGQAVKIAVNHPGWYRVTQSELVAAGLDPNVNPTFLQLYADGVEQAISVNSSTGAQLSADGFVEFYGTGMDTPTSDKRTYWLVAGSTPGLRVNGQQSKSSSTTSNDTSSEGAQQDAPTNMTMEAPTDAYSYTVERKDKLIYFTALLNGEADNFFGPVISKTAAKQDVTLSDINLNTSGPATLEVAVQGVTMQTHKVRVTVNGFEAGSLEFSNQEHAVNQFQIPRAYLIEGNNAIALTSLNGDSDVNLADYVRMTYWHSYHADADALVLSSSHTTPISVDGFTTSQVRVFNITDPNSVTQVNVKVSQKGTNYSIKIPGGRGSMRLLMAVADSQVQHPAEIKMNEPSNLSSSNNRADFVILTHRTLRDSVKPLADLRRSQGLETMVVDVEDVYDEFSYGAKSPSAIKDFLETAKNSWNLAPRYVLFVGDASYDPRNYVGFANQDLVPTKLVDATYLETSSDDALVDFDGDGLADMSVGRLPAQTAQQAQSLISKIINFAPGQTANAALLVSDHLEGYDFEAASNQVRNLLPASLTVTMVNRRDNPTTQVKADIINAINAGPLLVNYAGHGSPDVWTNGAILSSSDIDGLTNGNRLPFFVSMTCLNGRFQDSNRVSLAEALLKTETGGAIAVWASSGLTEPDAQSAIDQQLMRLLFSDGQPITLGDAVREAKATTNDINVRRTWVFFGDPTMRLK